MPDPAPVDAEQAVVLAIGIVTFAIGVYDVFVISRYLRPFATHRHLIRVILATAAYALFNCLGALFRKDTIVLSGFMAMSRLYYVRSCLLLDMSYTKIDGHGGVAELTDHIGSILSKKDPKKDAGWVNRRVIVVNLWFLSGVALYIVRSLCEAYNAFIIVSQIPGLGVRVRFWDGAFFYTAVISVVIDITCKTAYSQLTGEIAKLMHPRNAPIMKVRALLFNFFYFVITILLVSVIRIIFAANIDVDDHTYGWWNKHQATFIASFLLPYQYFVHRYFKPPYGWGPGLSEVQEISRKVKTKEDVMEYLRKQDIIFLATDDSVPDTQTGVEPAGDPRLGSGSGSGDDVEMDPISVDATIEL